MADQNRADLILVVEDDPSIRHILKLQLEMEGYEVMEAEDGSIALERVQERTPDLILLDMMMPNMDGHTTCKHLRADHRFRNLPVIFLTAKSDVNSKLEGLVEGGNDYLTKPYDRGELIQRIKNLLVYGRANRHSNPLTGLPGNLSIEAELEKRMRSGADFAFLYLDLDHFKAYNDFYGYREGDRVIQLLADVLWRAVVEHGSEADFVGHVGGDDFVILAEVAQAGAVAEAVLRDFDQQVLALYQPRERDQGFVEIENRRGEVERFPLVSVTIAMVETARYDIEHVAMLNDVVAELKKLGKQQPGSVIIRDRRQDPPVLRTGSDG